MEMKKALVCHQALNHSPLSSQTEAIMHELHVVAMVLNLGAERLSMVER